MATLPGANLRLTLRKVLIFSFQAGTGVEHRAAAAPLPPTEELLVIKTRGKVSSFSDAAIKLVELTAIRAYLVRKLTRTGLYTAAAHDYGRALQFSS